MIWLRGLMIAAVMVAGLTAAAASDDSAADSAPKLTFHIPEQPLVMALQVYSAISGVHVLYESGVELGLHSAAVDGEFTREAALQALLSDSNLVVRYARSDSAALVNPAAVAVDEPPSSIAGVTEMVLDTLHVTTSQAGPDRNALTDYIGAIQQDLQQALRKDGKAKSGSYRVGVDLWVDQSRVIRKTEVFRSTGDRGRDMAIAEALQGVVIRQDAPERTPQPVRVVIVVRSL